MHVPYISTNNMFAKAVWVTYYAGRFMMWVVHVTISMFLSFTKATLKQVTPYQQRDHMNWDNFLDT